MHPLIWLVVALCGLALLRGCDTKPAFAGDSEDKVVDYYWTATIDDSVLVGSLGHRLRFYPSEEDTTGNGKDCVWSGTADDPAWKAVPDSTDAYDFYGALYDGVFEPISRLQNRQMSMVNDEDTKAALTMLRDKGTNAYLDLRPTAAGVAALPVLAESLWVSKGVHAVGESDFDDHVRIYKPMVLCSTFVVIDSFDVGDNYKTMYVPDLYDWMEDGYTVLVDCQIQPTYYQLQNEWGTSAYKQQVMGVPKAYAEISADSLYFRHPTVIGGVAVPFWAEIKLYR